MAASLMLAMAGPAAAEPTPQPSDTSYPHNPWMAVGTNVLAPVAFGILPIGNTYGVLAPVGLSVGYLYAGDPGRGGTVTLIGYGAMIAGGLLGAGTCYALGKSSPTTNLLYYAGAGGGIGLAAVDIWSLFDVYQTTERLNAERLKEAEAQKLTLPTPAPSAP